MFFKELLTLKWSGSAKHLDFASFYEYSNGIPTALIIIQTYFHRLVSHNFSLISKIVRKDLIVPEFQQFVNELTKIYNKCKDNSGGEVTTNRIVSKSQGCRKNKMTDFFPTECLLHS